jgi:regulator of CtrA degradation
MVPRTGSGPHFFDQRVPAVGVVARLCHHRIMQNTTGESRIHRRLIDQLYVEAMVLADEARTYFDEEGRAERNTLSPLERVGFSCESLKVTTRLMHVIAWLLTQRAVAAGELRPHDALDPARRLGEAPQTEEAAAAVLPLRARLLIMASSDLHRRIARLDSSPHVDAAVSSPARAMQQRLALAF